jgi:acetoacetate decarboxylase
MREKDVLNRAFAMPLTNPSYPPGPYRFVNREYLIITYRWSNTNSSGCRIRMASATTPRAAR